MGAGIVDVPLHPTLADFAAERRRRYEYSHRHTVKGVLIFLTCFVGFIVYNIYDGLSFVTPHFWIESSSVSGLQTTATDLSATWNLTLFVANIGSKDILLEDSEIYVFYGSPDLLVVYGDYYKYCLAKKMLNPMFLKVGEQTQLNLQLGIVGATITAEQSKAISEEKAMNGSVTFGVFMHAWIGVYCLAHPLQFIFSSATNNTGVFTGQAQVCAP